MLIALCILSCVLFEGLTRIIMKKEQTIGDMSAVLTGILLALNLPGYAAVLAGDDRLLCGNCNSKTAFRRSGAKFCQSGNRGQNRSYAVVYFKYDNMGAA